ncbi:MAG: hypothetical protein JW770_04000 [Actinobacteria bacterium]|nr:hypothetical protein [Actinomycetota bacterium]
MPENYISLNGSWRLKFQPEEHGIPDEEPHPDALEIDALVPGNIELDLMRAGLEDDPFFGTNSINYRKYEFYSWWFERDFDIPGSFAGEDIILRFDGLDTYATIWINGTTIGKTSNMLIAYEFDVTAYARPGNTNHIRVHITSSVNHARSTYFPAGIRSWEDTSDEFLMLRKPPHSIGWDISVRLFSAGLWRDVSVYTRPKTRITEIYYATMSVSGEKALISVRYRFITDETYISKFLVRISGSCGNSSFLKESMVTFVSGKVSIAIENPQLWWPDGYGEPALYDVNFELVHNGKVVDSRHELIGLRYVEIERSYGKEPEQNFLIKVNHTPIMVKGTNWGPLDVLHSRDRERLPMAHSLLNDLCCNMVRCCGVNVYESDDFFTLCDKRGIMVWQDFAMACGIYSQYDDFADVISDEAVSVIRRLRNHPSLVLWSGDNEIDMCYVGLGQTHGHSRNNRISREVLPRAIMMHDPYRDYIPSSPYIPLNNIPSDLAVPEQHNWGPRDYFKGDYYKHSSAYFISEAGYHGCPSASSLKRFLPAEELWPFKKSSKSWRAHNTDYLGADPRRYDRNELMINQVHTLFGSVPDDLKSFVLASQISQAEALKFFIETTRIKKWRRTGILWWNLIDGWPQISDSIVDYYGNVKIAYHYIRRLLNKVCIMMTECEAWGYGVILANDSRENFKVCYTITDGETGEVIHKGEHVSEANKNIELFRLRCIPGEKKLYLINWEVGGIQYGNHYAAGFAPMDFIQYCRWIKKIEALPGSFKSGDCCK